MRDDQPTRLSKRRRVMIERRVDNRLHALYRKDAIFGPIGIGVLALIWGVLSYPVVPTINLLVWVTLMTASVAMLSAALVIPRFQDDRDRFGIPKIAKYGNLVGGTGAGLMTWIAIDVLATEPLLIWKATALQFAVSCGTMSSPGGVRSVTRATLFPMWILGFLAAVVTGQITIALYFACLAVVVGSNLGPASDQVLELVELKIRLEESLDHDPLTGLLSRVGLERRVDAIEEGEVAALYIDLDLFKQVNDRYGHAAGDELLVTVADRIDSLIRAEDAAARLGGDEFAILIAGQSDPAGLSRRLIAELEHPIEVHGHRCLVSASIGWAQSVVPFDLDLLLTNADTALRQAKKAGRATVAAYPKGLPEAG